MSSCEVWECLLGFAYFWWCSVQYFVVRISLHVFCDNLGVNLCSVSFYIVSCDIVSGGVSMSVV